MGRKLAQHAYLSGVSEGSGHCCEPACQNETDALIELLWRHAHSFGIGQPKNSIAPPKCRERNLQRIKVMALVDGAVNDIFAELAKLSLIHGHRVDIWVIIQDE